MFRAGVITEEMALKYGATWDKNERTWIILRGNSRRPYLRRFKIGFLRFNNLM